jgi:chemotaxis protein histidine kinase CheA
MALAIGVTGCNRSQGPDPASANMAPADQNAPAAQNGEPVENTSYNQELTQAPEAPPELPDYSQPACPGDNYLWTPGYWAYSSAGYYWVPGAWVMAPYVGALWTPPWWGFADGSYIWHAGYWGPYVGFYGGINYGFGYTGRGFYGGYWQGGSFNYNRAVMNVNTRYVRNVYDRHVTNYTSGRTSYNGGPRGLSVRPTASEQVALRQRKMQAVPAQVQREREAAANRAQFASENRGRPAAAAAESRPIEGRNEAPAREAPTASARPEEREQPAIQHERAREKQAPRAAPAPEARRNQEAQHEVERAPQPQPRAMVSRPAPAARPEEARPAAPEARQAPHSAPEARPQAAQAKPAAEAHPAPPPKDERKHQQ